MSFTAEQCDALFAAVLIDDDVDAHTELPPVIHLDFSERQLADCFALCRQLWIGGVDRRSLVELVHILWRDGDLDTQDRLAFKYARAKFKHLRFAYSLYDASNRYPPLLDWVTTALGHLQDAFKNGQRLVVRREAAICRLFLTSGLQRLLVRELNGMTPIRGDAFRAYVLRQVDTLRGVLAQKAVTGAQFHASRKIVSRLVSFYDTLRTLEPTAERYMMSRSLAAVNGLMGQLHDDLIEQRLAGMFDYFSEPFALPAEIKSRLSDLVDRFVVEAR